MSPDEYQHAWQVYSARTRVTVDPGYLLAAVQRSRRELRRAVSWSDFGTIAIEAALILFFLFGGIALGSPWTLFLMVPALMWSIGFKLVVRARRNFTPGDPSESLLSGVNESLALVEHQIWFQSRVFWWSQFPAAIAMLIFFAHVSWITAENWLEAVGSTAFLFVFVLVVYGFTYYMNRYVIRTNYLPRRQELLALQASLNDETTTQLTGDFPILLKEICPSKKWNAIAIICAAILVAIGFAGIYLGYKMNDEYPKKSPFYGVRWDGTQPEVQVRTEWVKLVSLDGIPAEEIVAFSRQTYGDLWRKRFEEDLVELLTRMGHTPDDTVTLVVQSLTSSETQTFEDVLMSTAKRRIIRDAAQAEQRREDEANSYTPIPIDDVRSNAPPIEDVLESLRASHKLPALAAFVLRDGEVVERAAVGTRKADGDTPVALDAQWHLGSNTKAMTATLAGMLVEDGLLRWDSTIGEVLGEAIPDMKPEHRDTTLTMLLHHTAGVTPNIKWFSAPEDRVACAAQLLSLPPRVDRGTYEYSNGGYVVAGTMLEVVTGKRWETLIRDRLFDPLGMTNTGFGAPSRPGAPWGHEGGLFGLRPKDPSARNADNPPVLGPAGTVHATLDDYARFVAVMLEGAQGKDNILKPDTYATLFAPPDLSVYAMGWIVVERAWAGNRAMTHSGSNTMWYATVWLAPDRDMAFFAVTNVGGDDAGKAVNEVIEALIFRHIEQRTIE